MVTIGTKLMYLRVATCVQRREQVWEMYTTSPLTQAQPMDPSMLWNMLSHYPTRRWFEAMPPDTVLLELPLLPCECRLPVPV
jgi:hypothetical protein